MDRNGIPLAYDLFPGNESEKVHMRPIINRVKNEFSDSRTIFVADRGLNTSDNIYWIKATTKGTIIPVMVMCMGSLVRGADAEFKAWVISGGYQKQELLDEEGNKISFIHKSRIHPKELHVNVTSRAAGNPQRKPYVLTRNRWPTILKNMQRNKKLTGMP